MARDRVFTSSQYRMAIDDLKKQDVLGMGMAEGKDIFMLAVALGLNNPQQLKKREGLFLKTALKTADKALMASVLLGIVSGDDQIDECADLDRSMDLCEQCAETGYQLLQKKYNDAYGDPEVLERRMLKELEGLYIKNVEMDF